MRVAILIGTMLFTLATVRHAPISAPRPAAAVTGIVFDSLSMRGLAGATVQLVTVGEQATSRSTKSDATGHFEFGDVPVGSYLMGFFHALKQIGYSDAVSVEVFGRGLKEMAPEEAAILARKSAESVMKRAGVL